MCRLLVLIRRQSAQVFDDRSSQYRNRRGQNSIFNDLPRNDAHGWLSAAATLVGENRNDSKALDRRLDARHRLLNRNVLSGTPQIPWLDYTARLGDVVESCYGLALFYGLGSPIVAIDYELDSPTGRSTQWSLADQREEGGG